MILHFQFAALLCWLCTFVTGYNVSYNEYANHYNFLFKDYRDSITIPTARAIIFVEKLFDIELTHAQGYVNMFAYSCYYWIDPSIKRWNIETQFKLKYFTFAYNEEKCPLNFPVIKSSTYNQFVSISNFGLVFTCPHTTRRIICNHAEETRYPTDVYVCSYPLSVVSEWTWPVECGNYADLHGNINTTSNENCGKLNNIYYKKQKDFVQISSKDWTVKKISIAANQRYSYLSISLQRSNGPQYINDVVVAITLGIISSSIMLIPFHNKIRIFISIFLLLASNIWLRFGLAEQAFVQYSLNENVIKYYQVVLIVQLISLTLSCMNSLIVSKLYSHYQPPGFLVRICMKIMVLGRIDPIFKKQVYFIDGIPLNVEVKEDKNDRSSDVVPAGLMIGWKEITLILDRVVFLVLLTIVLITGICFLK